jgi:hypothetical protein
MGDDSRKELIALLNIDEHVAEPAKNADIQVSYAKYKECLKAQQRWHLAFKCQKANQHSDH